MDLPVNPPVPVRSRTIDRLAVRTYASRADMGRAAAADIAAALSRRLASQATARMIFAAAPSQSDALAALAKMPGLDWSRVTAFHMDEYIGLPPEAPQRFARWLDAHLFARIPFGAVQRIQPDPEPRAEAARYADLLAAAPIDIVCLGIGVNGHIAFNDPPVADFEDPADVKVVDLDETCRQQQVDDDCFATIRDVPRRALTLTVPRLMRAGELFCVVPGALKRAAVAATLRGPIATTCPASILRRHAAATLYLDPEADPDA